MDGWMDGWMFLYVCTLFMIFLIYIYIYIIYIYITCKKIFYISVAIFCLGTDGAWEITG